MKNFRKVLALILVVATLFSFTAMAGAAEYTDADKVTADYTAAVDVLSAIGILNGYTDGSFKPTQNIEREEMAKMVAVLSNAGDEISTLYASACTFADAKNSWAASYIAYCNQTGIIAGRSATTFDPDANVTGLETAKMLLCVLGFDAAEQGYIGSNWKVNVLRDAKNLGLLDGFAEGYDVSKAITREEAAQMFLNALQAPLVVGTLSGNIVKISNAVYAGKGFKDVTLIDAEKYGWVKLYGNVIIAKDTLASIYKGLDLTAGMDCYGNPGYVWTYMDAKGNTVFSKFYGYAPTLKYTTAASLAKDLDAEVNSQMHAYTLTWFEQGIARGTEVALTAENLAMVAADTGKGVLTQVYVDDVNHAVVITLKHTFIGQVSEINKKTNEFVVDGYKFSNKGYNFAEGDIILYWLCNDGGNYPYLHDAKVAEPVTATVTRVTTVEGKVASSTLVADGKTYEYEFNFGRNIDRQLAIMNPDNVGAAYDLYLDEYGYVMYYALHVEGYETGVAYALEGTNERVYVKQVNGEDVYKYTATLVDFDGQIHEDVEVDKAMYEAMKTRYFETYGEVLNAKGLLVQYEVRGGVACLTAQNVRPVTAKLNVGTGAITDLDGNEIVWGTNNTKYLVRTWDYANGTYKYTAITGKNNIDASYIGQLFENGVAKATMQYFADANGFVSYVFVDALYASSTNYAYIIGYEKSVGDVTFVSQIGAYDAYKAIVNGESAYVFDTVASNGVQNKLTKGMYKSKMEVVGLTDEGVPVYANTTPLTAVATDEFYFTAGVLWYKTMNEYGVEVTVKVDWDDTMVVVVFADGTFKVLEDNNELNDYVEKYGWDVANGWILNDALYIEVQ